MSGGSYDYLYCKDVGDLINGEGGGNLERMADCLAQLGYADDAAKETLEVLLEIRQARNRIDTRTKRLSEVWRAIEWWDSCDSSEDGLLNALATYRK
jgi:hypothetical protein